MESPNSQPTMNQKIFDLGLSTEAVSLYLLCCHLQDTHTTMSRSNITSLWNGSEEALSGGIDELGRRQILMGIISSDAGITVYRLNDADDWKA